MADALSGTFGGALTLARCDTGCTEEVAEARFLNVSDHCVVRFTLRFEVEEPRLAGALAVVSAEEST